MPKEPRRGEPRPKNQEQAIRDMMNRLKYIGEEELSATQLRKKRRAFAKAFVDRAKKTFNWEMKIDVIWKRHFADQNIWRLEGWIDPQETEKLLREQIARLKID